jgi:hypothetical protein
MAKKKKKDGNPFGQKTLAERWAEEDRLCGPPFGKILPAGWKPGDPFPPIEVLMPDGTTIYADLEGEVVDKRGYSLTPKAFLKLEGVVDAEGNSIPTPADGLAEPWKK